jgi:hypothetical protein
MPEARPIRDDISAEELRRRARRESNGRVASRLLGLVHALEGMDRGEAARLAGMDRQTLRDWVLRFNAEGVEGLRDRPKSGRPTWLDEGSWRACAPWSCVAPTPSATASALGGPRICAGSSRSVAASPIARTACSGCSTTSACRGRRRGRSIPKPTARPRPASKKIPGADRSDRPRPSRGRAARDLVPR